MTQTWKKRGRKPKPKNVTEEEVPVGSGRPTLARNALETEEVPVGSGRPTLARNALETDVVQPVLRRSERSKK